MPSTVFMTSAGGIVAAETLQLLLRAGNTVRLPDNSSAGNGEPDERLQHVSGNLASPEDLDGMLHGVDKIFVCLPLSEDMVALNKTILEAAKRAGVRHIVRLSTIGASSASHVTIPRLHGEADRMLENSGIACTFIRAHYFMQNLLAHAGTIGREGNLYARMRDGRIGMVDARDVAAVAAAALNGAAFENVCFDVTGPEALSFAQVADKLSDAVGLLIQYVDVPPDRAMREMTGAGFSEWLAGAMLELFAIYSAGFASTVTDTVQKVTKRPAIRFDAFARQHAGAFL